MRHSWKQEKANQTKHGSMNKHTTQTNSTNNNKQQQTHPCFLLCVLLCLLCSLLTYKGTCGIVGNKKITTKQTQKNEQTTQKNKQHKQQQTTTNTYLVFYICALLCLFCSLLTYKGTCGIVGNKTRQNKTKTEHMNKQHKTTNTTNNNKQQEENTYMCVLFCVLLCLLRSLLTYTGTCGIVGNKKKHTNPNTETCTNNTQNTTSTNSNKQQNTYMFFWFCGLFCSL